MPRAAPDSPRLTFRSRHRLAHARHFDRVYQHGAKRTRGPLTLFAVPNDLPEPRLGLSVSRRVGTAVARNTIKRRLREAYRHLRHDIPAPLDFIVVVRPHKPLPLADYQRLLAQLISALIDEWRRRAASPPREAGPP